MRRTCLIIFGLFLTCAPAQAFILSGFETPESFISDPEDGSYYVSNINGEPLVKDGNGFISKISSNGNIVIQKYIGGTLEGPVLNAPKGLAILEEEIFVTDIDSLKVFNKRTRKLVKTIDFSPWKAQFLNDITTDGKGSVYVSDMFTSQIFKIDIQEDYRVSIFNEGPELGQPNGLAFNPKTGNLMVVTFGSGMILEIDDSGKVHALKKGLKTLDGIDYDGDGNLYVSSFEKGEVYQIAHMGRAPLTVFLSNLTTPADISYDRKRKQLLVPSFKGGTVSTVPKEGLSRN